MNLFTDNSINLQNLDSISGELELREKPVPLSKTSFPSFSSISYYLDGTDIVTEGDKTYVFTKDCVRISPPPAHDTHGITAQTVARGTYISIVFETPLPIVTETVFADVSSIPKIKDLFLEFNLVNKRKRSNYNLKLYSIFFNILYEICEFLNTSDEPKRFRKLEPAVKYIHTHYYDVNFQVGLLPEICGIKYAYFNRLFLEKFKTSPSKYVTALRMELAGNMLTSKKTDIEQIAKSSGYDSLSYFSQVFKKYYGVSPSLYKNHVRSRRATNFLPYFDDEDKRLCNILSFNEISEISDTDTLPTLKSNTHILDECDGNTAFAATATVSFKGKLFIAYEKSEKIVTVQGEVTKHIDYEKPLRNPIFGEDNGKLYIFAAEVEESKLHVFKFDDEAEEFEHCFCFDSDFCPCGNVITPASGRLMIPGSLKHEKGESPAVLLSDSGKIEAEWRAANCQMDAHTPSDIVFENPHTSAIVKKNSTYIFSRNDALHLPITYTAVNHDEYWNNPEVTNLYMSHGETASGNLTDGRSYLIGNTYPGRRKLAIFLSENKHLLFTDGFIIADGKANGTVDSFNFPSAAEIDGKIYVACIANSTETKRSTVVLFEIGTDFSI